MNKIEITVGTVLVSLVLLCFAGCNYGLGVSSMRKEAVQHGAAEYRLTDSPEPVFTWIK